MSDERGPARHPTKSFWTTFPGVLAAIGGFIGGVAALLTALVATGTIHGSSKGGPTTTAPSPAAPASSTPAVGQCAERHGLPVEDGGTKSEAEARDDLRLSNFFNVRIQYVSGLAGTPDRVLTQSPRPGTLTCPFDAITLTVRK